MEKRVIEFTTDKRFRFRAREQKTLVAMIRMYCHHHHPARVSLSPSGEGRGEGEEGRGDRLCTECLELADYARRRLERCVFGDAKPTCAHCVVHCYRTDMRERVRAVMRWAGPRMILAHPWLAFMHKVVDARRPAPLLPQGSRRGGS